LGVGNGEEYYFFFAESYITMSIKQRGYIAAGKLLYICLGGLGYGE